MSTPNTGDWVKALRPGTINATTGQKFIKAGEKFQLTDEIPFSDNWMEKTDAPEVAAPKEEDVKAEAEKAVREHEETDRIRRGKFSLPAVPRSAEGRKELEERRKAELKTARDKAKTEAQSRAAPPRGPVRTPPPAPDMGSRDPRAPGGVHETSNNPSRIDENATRKPK